MAIPINFNNRQIIEPGAYARVVGNSTPPPSPSNFGNVCLIDTGTGASWGGGSGISGTLASKKDSIYQFDDSLSFQNFVKGGIFWDLAPYLFSPSNNGLGAPKLFYIRAAATAPGTLNFTFTGGTAPGTTSTTTTSTTTTTTSTTSTTLAAGGTFTIQTKDEGLIVNGVKDTTNSFIVKGYGAKMFAGVVDTSKFYIEFYLGTFKGLDPDSDAFDGILSNNSVPLLVAKSIEFSNIADLITWANNDRSFSAAFNLLVGTVSGTGVIGSLDLSNNSTLKVVTGGTESYSSTHLSEVLDQITDLDNTFFLSDKNNTNAAGVNNQTILSSIINQSAFGKYIVIGGGDDNTTLDTQSIASAVTLNSSKAIICHSGIYIPQIRTIAGLKKRSSLYLAALVCGRGSGLEPQQPLTYKDLRILGIQDDMSNKDRIRALQAGVLHIKNVAKLGLVINQGINTLQNNTQFVNPDGQSYEISLQRIADQLNKELIQNSIPIFTGQNINTISPVDVKNYVNTLLGTKISKKDEDNLLISVKDVKVKLINGDYFVSYGFVANGPINRVFYTGTSLNINFSA